jgi:large subunit ribosomal protein L20
MARVRGGTRTVARRKRLLKYTKGFLWTRKSKYRQAKEAVLHAWSFQFADRKKKKREFRKLWTVKINAATRQYGVSYSRFINQLLKANVGVDRKILADLAEHDPKVFEYIFKSVQ